MKNIDDLFEREELSAAPDPGWPDCFNSGVFVYQPSLETYRALIELALTEGSFDGGDQVRFFFVSRHASFLLKLVTFFGSRKVLVIYMLYGPISIHNYFS